MYITPEEIEHLNEPERIKQLLKEVFPNVYQRQYPNDSN